MNVADDSQHDSGVRAMDGAPEPGAQATLASTSRRSARRGTQRMCERDAGFTASRIVL
jgi:hypothetical protein